MAKEAYEALQALEERDLENLAEAEKQADRAARKELGENAALLDMGEVVTTDYLLQQLAVTDRIDGLIDRCLKRLLMVRGIKSM